MAHVIKDRVYETTSSTGTAAFALAGAVDASYRAVSSVCSDGDTFRYTAVDAVGLAFEVGVGTYVSATNTVTRPATPEASSNSGALVSFANAPKIFLDATAASLSGGCVYLNGTLQSGNPNVLPRRDIFTSSGTWPKLTGATRVTGWALGAGGGGGSGCYGSGSTAGGGGGGGGARWEFDLPASLLNATSTITIGAAGTAGSAPAAGTTTGNAGGAGGNTSIVLASGTITCFGGAGGGGGIAGTAVGGAGGSLLSGTTGGGIAQPANQFGCGNGGASCAAAASGGSQNSASTAGKQTPAGAAGGGSSSTVGSLGGNSSISWNCPTSVNGGAANSAGTNAATPFVDYDVGQSGGGGGGGGTGQGGKAAGTSSGYGVGGSGGGSTCNVSGTIGAGAAGRQGIVVMVQS